MTELENLLSKLTIKNTKFDKLAGLIKGYLYRIHNLPNSIISIKHLLIKQRIIFSNKTDDGRLNSCIDEVFIINLLKQQNQYKNRIYILKKDIGLILL